MRNTDDLVKEIIEAFQDGDVYREHTARSELRGMLYADATAPACCEDDCSGLLEHDAIKGNGIHWGTISELRCSECGSTIQLTEIDPEEF